MMARSLKLAILLACLTVSARATVNNYFVNLSSGSDSNNGLTSGTAWLTIDHADSAISLGSTGTHIFVTGSVSRTTTLNTGHSGTSSARITWDGQGTSTITWTTNNNAGTCWLIGSSTSTGSYVTVQGFNLSGSCATAIGIRGDVDNALTNTIHNLDGTGGEG